MRLSQLFAMRPNYSDLFDDLWLWIRIFVDRVSPYVPQDWYDDGRVQNPYCLVYELKPRRYRELDDVDITNIRQQFVAAMNRLKDNKLAINASGMCVKLEWHGNPIIGHLFTQQQWDASGCASDFECDKSVCTLVSSC